jgi:hypothetical protein
MQPGIGVRQRVCRELVLSLTSAERAEQLGEAMNNQEAREEGRAQVKRVRERISTLAIAAPEKSRYNRVIENEQCPVASDLTANMLKMCFPVGAGTAAFFRSYSGVAHGEIYALMNFMTSTEQTDGSTLLTWQLEGTMLSSAIQIAIAAFREPFRRINQVMGWGRIEYDLWAAKLDKILSSIQQQHI